MTIITLDMKIPTKKYPNSEIISTAIMTSCMSFTARGKDEQFAKHFSLDNLYLAVKSMLDEAASEFGNNFILYGAGASHLSKEVYRQHFNQDNDSFYNAACDEQRELRRKLNKLIPSYGVETIIRMSPVDTASLLKINPDGVAILDWYTFGGKEAVFSLMQDAPEFDIYSLETFDMGK